MDTQLGHATVYVHMYISLVFVYVCMDVFNPYQVNKYVHMLCFTPVDNMYVTTDKR